MPADSRTVTIGPHCIVSIVSSIYLVVTGVAVRVGVVAESSWNGRCGVCAVCGGGEVVGVVYVVGAVLYASIGYDCWGCFVGVAHYGFSVLFGVGSFGELGTTKTRPVPSRNANAIVTHSRGLTNPSISAVPSDVRPPTSPPAMAFP